MGTLFDSLISFFVSMNPSESPALYEFGSVFVVFGGIIAIIAWTTKWYDMKIGHFIRMLTFFVIISG